MYVSIYQFKCQIFYIFMNRHTRCASHKCVSPRSEIRCKLHSDTLPVGDIVNVTHSIRLLIRVDAGLASCREVTVHFEGVSRATLVWIDPVLACGEHPDKKNVQT